MHRGVEGELDGRQVRDPVGALGVDEDAEGLQDRAVQALDQAVRLGVESRGHAELDLSALREGCPEPAREAWVPPGHCLGVEGLAIARRAAARNEDGFLAQVVGDYHE
eukprot:1984740-Rhodomonas_salina.1